MCVDVGIISAVGLRTMSSSSVPATDAQQATDSSEVAQRKTSAPSFESKYHGV